MISKYAILDLQDRLDQDHPLPIMSPLDGTELLSYC